MDELGRMLGIHSAGSRVQWVWIIEYLSGYSQIDTSIIRGLIEEAPVLPEDLGENATERVALRCLEELYGFENGLENVPTPESRISFDLSLSCKDVLEQILQEVPLSNLKNAGSKLLKWDVLPFINHKRASQPKCALEQFKDLILEKIPVLDADENMPKSNSDNKENEIVNEEDELISQNQKSGNEALQVLEKIPVTDGDENMPKPKSDNKENDIGDEEDELISQNPKNGDEALQVELHERNLLSFKRCRDDLVAGNLAGLVSVNQGGVHNNLHLNAKKFKQDVTLTCTIQSDEQFQVCLHNEEIKVTDIECSNLGKDAQVGEGDQHGHVASENCEQSGVVAHLEMQDNQMENVQIAGADVMVEQEFRDRHYKDVGLDGLDESKNVGPYASPKGPSGDTVESIDKCLPLISFKGEGDQKVHVASKNCGPSGVVAHLEMQDNQMENVQLADADMMVEQEFRDRHHQNVGLDESKNVGPCASQKGSSGDTGENIDKGFPLISSNSISMCGSLCEAEASMVHPSIEEICKYDDERFDIVSMKSIYMRLQCAHSQDPVSKAGCIEQNICLKCKQNGQVLVCNSKGCPVVIHENCLNTVARFDEKGNFYCPACLYFFFMSKYQEARHKIFLARKALAAWFKNGYWELGNRGSFGVGI